MQAKNLPEAGRIDWSANPSLIADRIRALSVPGKSAFAFYEGRKVYIAQATPVDSDDVEEFNIGGIILGRTDTGIIVSAGTGRIEIRRLQFEGEKEISGAGALAAGRVAFTKKFS